MNKPLCYETSRDYKHLRELLDQGYQVVCFTTYNFFKYDKGKEPYMVTDVCIGSKTTYGCYDFGVGGQGYGDYDPEYHKFSFEDFCEKCLHLEFIEPTISKEE